MRPATYLLLALTACRPPSPSPSPPKDAPHALAAAPLAATEATTSRRQAVLDVLTDGRSAAALAIVANEPNEPFDAHLAEQDSLYDTVFDRRGIPAVVQRGHTVTGPLDKDLVRRSIRTRINDTRRCYNEGLARDRRAGGVIVIDFMIDLTGKVLNSAIRSSTVADAAVNTCILDILRRVRFPKPDGATADVSFEYVLAPWAATIDR